MIGNNTPSMTREDREELAAAAMSADRRNTPKVFLVFGGAFLVLGIIMLAVSLVVLGAAKGLWSVHNTQMARIENLAAQHEALQTASNDKSNIQVHPPISSMGSDIQRYASQAGVSSVSIPKTTHQTTLRDNARIALYSYPSVTDESLAELLEWVHTTVQNVPGMRVDKIVIRLTANTANANNETWKMEVTFARTEQS